MSGDFLNNGKEEIEFISPKETCPHCGAELGEDKSYCCKCGKYLGSKNNGYKPLSAAETKKVRLIIGIVAVVVFIILYFTVVR